MLFSTKEYTHSSFYTSERPPLIQQQSLFSLFRHPIEINCSSRPSEA